MASDAAAKLRQMCGVLTCPLCSRLFSDPHRFSGCGHEFCRECIMGKLEGPGVTTSECPTCRQPAWKKDLVADQLYASLVGILRSSPGAEAGSAAAGAQQEPSRPAPEAAAPRPAGRSSSPKRKRPRRQQRKQGAQPAKAAADAAAQGAAGYAQLTVRQRQGPRASTATPAAQRSGQQQAVPATPEGQRSPQQPLPASPAQASRPAPGAAVAQPVPATPAERSRSLQQGQPQVVPATPAEQRGSQQEQGGAQAGSVQDTPPPSQLAAEAEPACSRGAQVPSGEGRGAGLPPAAALRPPARDAGWAQSFAAEVRQAAQPTQLYDTPLGTAAAAAPASGPGSSGAAAPPASAGERFGPAWAAEELARAGGRPPEGASLPGLVAEVSALLAAVSQAQQLLAAQTGGEAGAAAGEGGSQRSLEDLDAAMRQHGFRFTETEQLAALL